MDDSKNFFGFFRADANRSESFPDAAIRADQRCVVFPREGWDTGEGVTAFWTDLNWKNRNVIVHDLTSLVVKIYPSITENPPGRAGEVRWQKAAVSFRRSVRCGGRLHRR
jgi:hypothetical protein